MSSESLQHCPSDQELKQFALGAGAPHRIEQIALHLIQSPKCACHGRLEQWHQESDDFMQTLRKAKTANPYEGEAECQAAVCRAASVAQVAATDERRILPTLEGSQVGKYRDLQLLGRGGMGEVYRAFDDRLQRHVALKLIRHDRFLSDSAVRRFHVEAALAARLEHPHIVPVYDFGQEADHHFLAMKLVDGQPLSTVGDRYREDPRLAAQLVIPLAQAIHHAHQRLVLHRDLKPANILVDEQGVPYITDFGLAKILGAESDLTQSGSVVGTPSYMAPEQAVGLHRDIITTTDIYGLGGILFFLLTGQPPVAGDDPLTVLRRVVDCEPVRPSSHNPKVDRDLDTICLKCLSKDPRRRYVTALALAEDLQRWLDGLPIEARPVTWRMRCVRWCRRRPAVAALTGAVTGLTLLVAIGSPLVAVSLQRQATQAKRNFFESQLSLARAERLSDRPDRREAGLAAIRGALAVVRQGDVDSATWLQLRNETLACLSLPAIRESRKWLVSSVAATDPTGNLYAFVADDSDIRLRRVSDGQQIARIDTANLAIDPIHFSPAGHYLGVRVDSQVERSEGGYRLYSVPDGQLQWSFVAPVRWNRVAFTPDERQMVLVDFEGHLHVLDTKSGRELADYETGLGDDFELAVHPLGEKVAFARRQGQGQSIFIHDLLSGDRIAELKFPFQVWTMAWSPDGNQIAVGSDGLFSLWDVAGPTLLRTFSGHRRLITQITFHPQGRLIATCGYDGATRVWDAVTGEALARLPSYSAYFTKSSGQLIVVGSFKGQESLEWWDFDMPNEMTTLSLPEVNGMFPRSIDFSSDGASIVAAGDDGIRSWEGPSSQYAEFMPLPGAFGVAHLPQPGTFLLGSSQGLSELRLRLKADNRASSRFDSSTVATSHKLAMNVLHERNPQTNHVFHRVAVSEDGRRVAWIRDRAQLVLWDRPADVVRQISVSDSAEEAPCLAISPSGRTVVSSDGDGLAVWDFDSGVRLVTLGDTSHWCHATFDATGRWLVVGDEHRYRCWATDTWRLVRTISRSGLGLWGASAFSPDGKLLALASSRSVVKLLDADTAEERCTLPTADYSMDICHIVFSPDGQRLLVSGENRMIQVWHLDRIHHQLQQLGLAWGWVPLAERYPDTAKRQN